MKDNNRLTMVERTDREWHRSPIIMRRADESFYYFAEFESTDQLDFFAQTLGFTYTAESWKETERCGIWSEYKTSHRIISKDYGFWKLEDLPADAKPIKALSNGHLVTCYFTNDGETITFYRPNPNAHDVYKPMNIHQHVAHLQVYGCY